MSCTDKQKAAAKRYADKHPDRRHAAYKSWYEKNRTAYLAKRREGKLIDKYDMTNEDYDIMSAKQNGGCAICGGPPTSGRWKRFAVDHDHATGKVRGLLCECCNRAIGLLKDDPKTLRVAADYLEAT